MLSSGVRQAHSQDVEVLADSLAVSFDLNLVGCFRRWFPAIARSFKHLNTHEVVVMQG